MIKHIFGHSFEIAFSCSSPDPGTIKEYKARGIHYMQTSDLTSWICVDSVWYSSSNCKSPINELYELIDLAETEDELVEFINSQIIRV